MSRLLIKYLLSENPWTKGKGDKIISINVTSKGNIVVRVGNEKVILPPEDAYNLFADALSFVNVVWFLKENNVNFEELWEKYKKLKGKTTRKTVKKTTKKKKEEQEESKEGESEQESEDEYIEAE